MSELGIPYDQIDDIPMHQIEGWLQVYHDKHSRLNNKKPKKGGTIVPSKCYRVKNNE